MNFVISHVIHMVGVKPTNNVCIMFLSAMVVNRNLVPNSADIIKMCLDCTDKFTIGYEAAFTQYLAHDTFAILHLPVMQTNRIGKMVCLINMSLALNIMGPQVI